MVNNIAIDPLDENYFASAGSTDDPSVTVWDKRWIGRNSQHLHPGEGISNGEVFNFRPVVDNTTKTTVWSLRFSGLQRGRLAICSSTGQLKVVDMSRDNDSRPASSEHRPYNPYGGGAWVSNRYVSKSQSIEKPWHDQHHGRPKESRIVAFDWIDQPHNNRGQPLLALRQNQEVTPFWMTTSSQRAEITARQDLCIASQYLTITPPQAKHSRRTASTSSSKEVCDKVELDDDGATHLDNRDEPLQLEPGSHGLAQLLSATSVQYHRCLNGYLFDCQKNEEMVAGNWMLERLWEIVNRFRLQAQDDNMVYSTLDLSYVGVTGIWLEKLGISSNRHLGNNRTSAYNAIVGLNAAQELPPFEGERTEYPEHRQLCLAACGWKFTTETLEEECQELIDRGLYYQAIVQAVLHNYKHIALNLLRTLIRSKTVPNIGLGALLAADHLNDEQREMCLWMQADTPDPPLKALLTFLSSGNWRDVMKTNYLHLGYRVALGLKYLNDTELSGFIQSETARAVKNGDLEGILLTGLEDQSMDLFQTYIVKTNDLQTAVLATAFTNPLYVRDVRWQMWKETYFEQMQYWRCFMQRVRFTTQHARMARTREGKSLLEPHSKHTQLRCQHCHASLARGDSPQRSRTGPSSFPTSNAGAVRPATETSCLECHRPMPRCGICLLWLGTAYPKELESSKSIPKAEHASHEDADPKAIAPKDGARSLETFVTFCMACKHGFHAEHAQLWFKKHKTCPIPDCSCNCGIGYTGQA